MSASSTKAPPTPWLEAREIVKSFGGVRALRGASLELREGDFHGLIGPNGAGKSTLVNVLSGAIAPDEGGIIIHGESVRLHDPAEAIDQRVVLMPQKLAVIPNCTIADNITLGREPSARGIWSARQARQRAATAMATIGLDLDPSQSVDALSPVEKRLIMLARAIDQDPRLLILDEPTSGLPPHEAHLVLRTVQSLMRSSALSTVLFVSHDLSDVASASDAVTCIREGVAIQTLRGSDITKPRLVDLMLGLTPHTPSPDSSSELAREEDESRHSLELDRVTAVTLREVSARFTANRVTGVAGLLGSGESELMQVLAGVTRPVSGQVLIDGKPQQLRSPAHALRHGIAFLGGERSTTAFSTLSIRENVSVSALQRWFGRLGLLSTRRERRNVAEPLAALSVQADPDRGMSTLSGGNQQRALISRLLAVDAPIVVIKEPTVGVDIGARQQLWEAVRALAHGRTVVVASGDTEELTALCDRVICMRRGAVVRVLEGADVNEHAITAAIS